MTDLTPREQSLAKALKKTLYRRMLAECGPSASPYPVFFVETRDPVGLEEYDLVYGGVVSGFFLRHKGDTVEQVLA